MVLFRIVSIACFAISIAGCSIAPQAAKDGSAQSASDKKPSADDPRIAHQDALRSSGVAMPEGSEAAHPLDQAEVDAASAQAQGQSGDRGAWQNFHSEVMPILPVKAGGNTFNFAETDANPVATSTPIATPSPDVDGGGGGGGGGGGNNPCGEKVCATACASASATAAAFAFAHASVRACAFAEAWACVFERVPPFNRVCSWARSEACASAFASAFGVGFAHANDSECKTVCSDGTTTTTRGPDAPAAAAKVDAQQ